MTTQGTGSFIKFLENNHLLMFNVLEDNEKSFVNRLKIQKYTYLAKYYGLDLGYSHSMYKRGPYSPSLAITYYDLAKNPKSYEIEAKKSLPKSFDATDFLSLVKGKDVAWLEIATTILDQKERFNNETELVKHVELIKCDYKLSFIKSVLKDLKSKKLVTYSVSNS
jgi:uncharacterized protein YwgA